MTLTVVYSTYLLSMERDLIKDAFRNYYYSVYDSAMTLDLGFSSLRNISLDKANRTLWGSGLGFLAKTPQIIIEKFRGFPSRPPLKKLYIQIKFQNHQQLLKEREQAMRKDILEKPRKIKAEFLFEGERYKANIRLKGDLNDHWRSNHQISLRVAIKGKNSILGFKKFSLQKVRTRQFPFDHVFQSMMRQTGNLSPIHKYIRVFVNGESWGIMNVEEHMSKEFLEKQGRKNSIILKFGNEKIWNQSRIGKLSYPHYRLSDSKLNIKLYSQNKYLKNEMHRKWFTYLAERRLYADNDELYNLDRYATALILAKIWNNTHTLEPPNSRHYFNPYLLKLEPITTDQGSYSPLQGANKTAEIPEDIYQQIINTGKYKSNFSANYLTVSNALKNIEGEFSTAQSYFPVDDKINPDVLSLNKKTLSEIPDEATPKTAKTEEPQVITKLPSDLQAKEFSQHLHIRHYEDGELKIYNLLPDTVNLKKLVVDEGTEFNLDLTIPGYSPGEFRSHVFQTKLRGIFDDRITAETVYRGNSRSHIIGPTLLNNVRNPLLPDEARTDHPFLKKTGENEWKIDKGTWHVNKPIVIHGDLSIEAGAEFYFSEKAYLIVIGSIYANGTASSKIVFAPQNKRWKGLYVIGDGRKPSDLKNITIRSTSGLKHDMLDLTGGVTFYDANVSMEDVLFETTFAEDALNLVNTKYLLKNVRFSETISDAFDSDFSSGKIIASVFNDIQGDALDFSGSDCDIKDVDISGVRDKAISVGEKSRVSIEGVHINGVGIGVVSKDGSSASISNSSIKNYSLHAVMTYNKKGFYDGKTRIGVSDTEVMGDHPFAMQAQTQLQVDGVEVPAINIDVRELYKTDEMKK